MITIDGFQQYLDKLEKMNDSEISKNEIIQKFKQISSSEAKMGAFGVSSTLLNLCLFLSVLSESENNFSFEKNNGQIKLINNLSKITNEQKNIWFDEDKKAIEMFNNLFDIVQLRVSFADKVLVKIKELNLRRWNFLKRSIPLMPNELSQEQLIDILKNLQDAQLAYEALLGGNQSSFGNQKKFSELIEKVKLLYKDYIESCNAGDGESKTKNKWNAFRTHMSKVLVIIPVLSRALKRVGK